MLNGKRIKNIIVIHASNIFPIISILSGKRTKHDSVNLKHKKKNDSFYAASFFADVKLKVVKTHRQVYDNSAKS